MPRKLTLALLCLPALSYAADIYDRVPAKINASERYVIFSHGAIAEGTDPRPVSPEYGVYDFPAIKQAIFKDGSFNLIAPQRPKNTDVAEWGRTIASWVRELTKAGVPASRISIVGFSRGSFVTAHASSLLRDTGVHTALMGACANGDIRSAFDEPLVLGGNLLNIYETTDTVRECDVLAKRSALKSFQQVSITTGKKHGAFYSPRAEWIGPLKEWIRQTNK